MSTLSFLGRRALTYASELGWPVFPVWGVDPNGACLCGDAHRENPKNVGKHPIYPDGFKIASQFPDAVGTWWDAHPDANIGFCPGLAGLIAFDLDSAHAAAKAKEIGLLDVETWRAETARGCHLYFRLPKGTPEIGNVSKWAKDGIDVRAHGGYTLLPPSRHRQNVVYRWIAGDFDSLTPLPARVLELLTTTGGAVPSATTTAPGIPSARGETVRALIEQGKRQGLSNDFIVDSIDRRVHRYLAAAGNREEGQGRNNVAYQISAWLLFDFAADPSVAWGYVVEWNERNAPPLSESELRRAFESAQKTGKRPVGCAHVHRSSGSAA
ncbi:MAG: bifunctional DNA primase/polymerase [Gemmatimonadales bacterium]